VTDENGTYSYTQDISQFHEVYIQPIKTTYFLSDNSTGGDCVAIAGEWDSETKTCSLTQDVYNNSIQIDKPGITLDCQNHKIQYLVRSGIAVYIYNTSHVTVKHCVPVGFAFSIRTYDSSDNIIDNNTFINQRIPVWLLNGYNNTVSNNYIRNVSSYAVIFDSDNNTFTDNNITGYGLLSEGRAGIYLRRGDNNIIEKNLITSDNKHFLVGIACSGSGHIITNNTISSPTEKENKLGIDLVYSNDIIVSYNTVYDVMDGIGNWYSENITIYKNNIFNNTRNIYFDGGDLDKPFNLNLSSSIGGNYWGGINNTDDNQDGFADTPFNLMFGESIVGTDYYPWVKENGWVDIDGDGYSLAADCDENNTEINPGAQELLDGIDNNCNGLIDDGLAFCGNGIVDFGEYCDDAMIGEYGFSCSMCSCSTCNSEFGNNIIITEEINEEGNKTYDYVFNDSEQNIPTIEIIGNTNLIDLMYFLYAYMEINEEGSEIGTHVELNGLKLDEGVTKSLTLAYGNYVCALDEEIVHYGNFTHCFEDDDRIVWQESFGNKCDQFGVGVVGKDKDGNDVPKYTCEKISYNGKNYTKVSGLSHSLVESTDLSDDDNDGYLSNVDCNDNNAAINPGTQEICDEIDNNCNNQIDENILSQETTCGVGICYNVGQYVCSYGVMIDICQPKQSESETCNGLDDDCNGVVDNDINSTETNCGIGACVSSGQLICQYGSFTDTCLPNEPQEEMCNGIDDDCDGIVDGDVLTEEIFCDVEETVSGEIICVDGEIVNSCNSIQEICNGVDDNYDGFVDENDYMSPVTLSNAPFDWVNYNIAVTLNATDYPIENGSCGVMATYYCVDEEDSCYPDNEGDAAEVEISNEGIYYLRYYSVDNYNENTEEIKSETIMIDKTSPIVEVVIEDALDTQCSFWFQWWIDDGEIAWDTVHGCAKVNADVSDELSGISSYTIKLIDSDNNIIEELANDSLYFNFDTDEKAWKIVLEAYDNAGNYVTASKLIYEDDDQDVALLNGDGGAPDLFDSCPADVPSIDENKDGCTDSENVNYTSLQWCLDTYTGSAQTSIYQTSSENYVGDSYVAQNKTWHSVNSEINSNVQASYGLNVKEKEGPNRDVIYCLIDPVFFNTSSGQKITYDEDDFTRLVYKNISGTLKIKEAYHIHKLNDGTKINAHMHYDENLDTSDLLFTYSNAVKMNECKQSAEDDEAVCKLACDKKDKICKTNCTSEAKVKKDICRDTYSYVVKETYSGLKTLSLYDVLKIVGYE